MSHLGDVFVISAPSGTGKSTIARKLVKQISNINFSISFTTRRPRPNEINGRDYYFIDDKMFDDMIAKNDFIEWVQIYNHRYGTSKSWIQNKLKSSTDILLDIESQGASKVHQAIPNAIMIFLLPPSPTQLMARLHNRGDESNQQVQIRLKYAKQELSQFEKYDYLVVNEDLGQAYQAVESIIIASRHRKERVILAAQQILNDFNNFDYHFDNR